MVKLYSRVEALQGYSSGELEIGFGVDGTAEVDNWVAFFLCNLQPLIYSVKKEDLHPSYNARDLPYQEEIEDDIET